MPLIFLKTVNIPLKIRFKSLIKIFEIVQKQTKNPIRIAKIIYPRISPFVVAIKKIKVTKAITTK